MLGYALYTDDATGDTTGTSTWRELVGYSSIYSSTTYTMTSGITAGNTYRFKVMAKNKWGWGQFSDYTPILAAAVPS